MNYELAKKLKDAGYNSQGDGEWMNGNGGYCDPTSEICEVFVPCLSTLIDSCGERFHSLRRGSWKGSTAFGWVASEDVWDINALCARPGDSVGVGNTPEEAVANLWLELNK